MDAIADGVRSSVERVLSSDTFGAFKNAQPGAEGDLVVINNSFLYRDTVKTTKNSLYLTVPDDAGSSGSVGVAAWGSMNSAFKRVAADSKNLPTVEPLADAVAAQIGHLGRIVLLLVGAIEEGPSVSVKFSAPFAELRYDPEVATRVQSKDGVLVVNSLTDVEGLWSEVAQLPNLDDANRSSLAPRFAETIEVMREQAPRIIRLGGATTLVPDDGLLGQIDVQMSNQISQYRAALDDLTDDGEDGDALSNILRISYSFSSDASDLITLFISLCDLKPIILWLTLAENVDLADAFARLPFGTASSRKPSLKTYADIIGGARNRAFHDFFAFDRPFEVDLAGVSIQAKHLRLFHAHGRAAGDAFDYEDRELVEVLRTFTRAPEHTVSLEFWRRNLDVLVATRNLVVAVSGALRLLATTFEG